MATRTPTGIYRLSKPLDDGCTYADVWWDRHTQCWILQRKDGNGYQVGDAIYVGHRIDIDHAIKCFVEEAQEAGADVKRVKEGKA